MYENVMNSTERELDMCMSEALAQRVTPGAVVGVAREGYNKFIKSYGYTEYITERYNVNDDTVFDLASLTKPLVTVVCLLTLLAQERISLQSTLVDLLPDNEVPADKAKITLWQLMSHCSGLPAHRNYYVSMLGMSSVKRKKEIVDRILTEKKAYSTGGLHVYSDLGYILLGVIVEQQTGENIENYYTSNIIEKLGLERKLFYPIHGEGLSTENCAATEICPWSNTLLAGVVHDDNCRVMGGAAGHAGLFGTADGVLELSSFLCRVWQGIEHTEMFSTDLLKEIMTRIGVSNWTCGFDTPSDMHSSSGRYLKFPSVGHLGFTGTSFWIDLTRGISIVLLTNRVHPSRNNSKIKELRPKVHDILLKKLE